MKISLTSKTRSGFSILDLLAAITVLGVVVIVIIPKVADSTSPESSATSRVASDLEIADKRYKAAINAAVEHWYIEQSNWPADDLSDIGQSKRHFPHGIPVSPITHAPYKLDPATHRAE